MALSHQKGREVLVDAFVDIVGRHPTTPELQSLTAISGHESGFFGNGWRSERGRESHNWGAVVDWEKDKTPCLETGFANTDSSPGEGVELRCFRMFESPLEGAKGLLKSTVISQVQGRAQGVRQAIADGDLQALAAVLYRTHYYEGLHQHNEAQRIGHYANSLYRHAQIASEKLGEPLSVQRPPPVRKGARVHGGVLVLGIGAGFFLITKGMKR